MMNAMPSLNEEEDHSFEYHTIVNSDRFKFESHKWFGCVPSKGLHLERNEYNCIPEGFLVHQGIMSPITGEPVYVDSVTGDIWHQAKWYHNLLHNPISNIKLLNFDKDEDEGSLGSSELIISKKRIVSLKERKTIHIKYIKQGSHNFRDYNLAGHRLHFYADILPNVIYCKCVGK